MTCEMPSLVSLFFKVFFGHKIDVASDFSTCQPVIELIPKSRDSVYNTHRQCDVNSFGGHREGVGVYPSWIWAMAGYTPD